MKVRARALTAPFGPGPLAHRDGGSTPHSTNVLFPGIEERLDGGDVDVLGQFDTVKTGPGWFRRGRAHPVTSEIIVQVPGAVDRHVNMVPFAVSLNTQRCLFLDGHNGSFLRLKLVENA